MELVQIGAEFGIEAFHAGKAIRRIEVEDTDKAVVAIQGFVALIAFKPPGCAQKRQAGLVEGSQPQSRLAEKFRLLRIAGQKRGARRGAENPGSRARAG